MTKDKLRATLARKEQRYKDMYGGGVTLYAAQPELDRKSWCKHPTVQDQALDRELQKTEEERLKVGQEAANPTLFASDRQESDGRRSVSVRFAFPAKPDVAGRCPRQ